MMQCNQLASLTPGELLNAYPYLESYFSGHGVVLDRNAAGSVEEHLRSIGRELEEEHAVAADELLRGAASYVDQMTAFLGTTASSIARVTLLPGTDKHGIPERFDAIDLVPGEVTVIVGPTGAGKSRLLADIEWVADSDTPTGRRVLLNGSEADETWRYSGTHKLVAQLSQNMNFVMDLSVSEFLQLHAESRLVPEPAGKIEQVIAEANKLAGEPFDASTAITGLSGGQSRALMIADTAVLSDSPVILIDEIENAGIDRRKALSLLLREEKIVLMATHDPMLALSGNRRIVIREGGISEVLETSEEERELLAELEETEARLGALRQALRRGKRVGKQMEEIDASGM